MKRKFVTEYGICYQNSYTLLMTAHQLAKGGTATAEQVENISKSHIYLVATRPSPYFDPVSLKLHNKALSGKVCFKVNGIETKVSFADYPWWGEDESICDIDCKYPFREIRGLNRDGKEVSYVPATYLAARLNTGPGNGEELGQYEVLYIGQALGNSGTRSAFDRLKSHSKLQKILALTNHDYPDKEIMVFMYQFDHAQLMVSIDGRAKEANNSSENETRLMNAAKNQPDKKQKIGLIEAGLIRYFQPQYNKIFKTKFPSPKHKILKSCYDLDISGFVVELDAEELGFALYSPYVKPKLHHIAQIDLTSSLARQSFFFADGLTNLPDVIK